MLPPVMTSAGLVEGKPETPEQFAIWLSSFIPYVKRCSVPAEAAADAIHRMAVRGRVPNPHVAATAAILEACL